MKKLSFVFLLAVVTLLAGCSSKQESLVVGVMPDMDSIPLIVAKQQGYFADNVELELFKSAMDRDSALYSNSLDGAVSDVLAVSLARDSEFSVYITSMTHGKYGLIASAGSGIKEVSDMNGKKIGLSTNTIIEYVTDHILENSSIDPATVEKNVVPKIPSRLELLSNNQIDAIAVPEPYVSAAVDAGGVLLQTSVDLNINPGIMLFTGNATEKKKEDIEEFYKAYNKAVDFIQNNPKSEYLQAVIDEVGLPDSTMDVELPNYTYATLPQEDEVTNAVAWLKEKGLIKTAYSFEELVFQYD